MRRHASLVLGAALLGIGVAACIATFLDERERVEEALRGADLAWLGATSLLALGTMAWVAAGWRRCLAALGSPAAFRDVGRWYFLGELGKYVPGGIWPVVGRGELARRAGVPATTAYQGVALSLAAWYGAALAPLAALAAHPTVQGRAARVVARVTRGRWAPAVLPWRTVAGLVLWYVPTWVAVGAATAATVVAYDGSLGWRAPSVAVVAWVAGFLAVPVPAGAGIREAVFVAASGLPPGLALTVAVTTRLAYVAADLTGALLAAAAGLGTERRSADLEGAQDVGVVVGPDRA